MVEHTTHHLLASQGPPAGAISRGKGQTGRSTDRHPSAPCTDPKPTVGSPARTLAWSRPDGPLSTATAEMGALSHMPTRKLPGTPLSKVPKHKLGNTNTWRSCGAVPGGYRASALLLVVLSWCWSLRHSGCKMSFCACRASGQVSPLPLAPPGWAFSFPQNASIWCLWGPGHRPCAGTQPCSVLPFVPHGLSGGRCSQSHFTDEKTKAKEGKSGS